jgi:hypothetical protein
MFLILFTAGRFDLMTGIEPFDMLTSARRAVQKHRQIFVPEDGQQETRRTIAVRLVLHFTYVNSVYASARNSPATNPFCALYVTPNQM